MRTLPGGWRGEAEVELELRDQLHISKAELVEEKHHRQAAEHKTSETEKVLKVSEANVRYFQQRQGTRGTHSREHPELSLETVFDILVG